MIGKEAGHLREFLSSLVGADRLLVLLHYYEGLSVSEISCVVNLPKLRVAQRLGQLRIDARRWLAAASAQAPVSDIAAVC